MPDSGMFGTITQALVNVSNEYFENNAQHLTKIGKQAFDTFSSKPWQEVVADVVDKKEEQTWRDYLKSGSKAGVSAVLGTSVVDFGLGWISDSLIDAAFGVFAENLDENYGTGDWIYIADHLPKTHLRRRVIEERDLLSLGFFIETVQQNQSMVYSYKTEDIKILNTNLIRKPPTADQMFLDLDEKRNKLKDGYFYEVLDVAAHRPTKVHAGDTVIENTSGELFQVKEVNAITKEVLLTQSSTQPGKPLKTVKTTEDNVTPGLQLGVSVETPGPFSYYYKDIVLGDYVWIPLEGESPPGASAQLAIMYGIEGGNCTVVRAWDSTIRNVPVIDLARLSQVRKRFVDGMFSYSRLKQAVLENTDIREFALNVNQPKTHEEFCFGVDEQIDFPNIREAVMEGSVTARAPLLLQTVNAHNDDNPTGTVPTKSEAAGEEKPIPYALLGLVAIGALILVFSTSN